MQWFTLSLSSLVSNILLSFLDRGLLGCDCAFWFCIIVELSAEISTLASAIIHQRLHVNFRKMFWSVWNKGPTNIPTTVQQRSNVEISYVVNTLLLTRIGNCVLEIIKLSLKKKYYQFNSRLRDFDNLVEKQNQSVIVCTCFSHT